MSVKTASELMTRVMRAAIKETISPANQGTRTPSERPQLLSDDRRKSAQQFGKGLQQQANAYTGLGR